MNGNEGNNCFSNNPGLELKWERKIPPMEQASPEHLWQYVLRLHDDSALWGIITSNIGKNLSREDANALLRFAQIFERDSGVYISPESHGDALVLLRKFAAGTLSQSERDMLNRVKSQIS